MKVLEEIKVSVYENVYSKKPKVMSFLEVIIMCIHPVYASIINAIRRYYAEGDHAAAQKLKSQLPCAYISRLPDSLSGNNNDYRDC